ncbi:hypothetical protein PHYBOEH_003198 [Phytophthora boehmeriae]|uniref:M96 mating-specific protein family n=1 Tax=Phytophthora boehmeriae TaxID=109152 RepID=A0A8T1WV70_9STRA|nr:hypothetical protein PHYBOEH_003198 [Phytophthora boehmeriae]
MPLQLQDDEVEALEAALSFVDALSSPPSIHSSTQDQSSSSRSASQQTEVMDVGEAELDSELNRLLLESLSASSSDHETTATTTLTTTSNAIVTSAPSVPPTISTADVSIQGRRALRTREPTTTLAKTKRRSKVNPNRARNERKHELAYLKSKVEQMETELEALRHRRHAKGSLNDKSSCDNTQALLPSCSNSAVASRKTPHIWRDIATRQQKRREKSERENARLKLVLESQVKLAKSMETLLQKRSRQQISGCAEVVGSTEDFSSQGCTLDFLVDKDTFEALLTSVETAYSELDAVFTTNGLLGLEAPCRDARMREGASGMYLDVFANKLLPFSYDAVAAAVWNHFRGNDKHRGVVYENATKHLERLSDTIMESFTMEFMGKTTRADFRVKQVHRRYVEEDRQVVVWVSIGQALDKATSPFSSFGFVDKGYVVTKRPTSINPEHGDFTVLQMCSLVSPQMAAGFSIDRTAAGDFTEFVLNVVAANTTFSQELIENVLLEQALTRRQEAPSCA